MGEYGGKRAAGEHSFSRSPGIAFRDKNNEDRNIQNCNRLGLSTRHSAMRGAQIGTQENFRYGRAPFRSMNGKAIAGSSSRSTSNSTSYSRSFKEQQNQRFPRESAIAESSSKQEIENLTNADRQVPVKNPRSDDIQRGKAHIEFIPTTIGCFESSVLQNISEDITESSINGSVPKSHEQINGKFGSGKQYASSSSFVRHPNVAYTNSNHPAKPNSQRLGSGAERCGLKSLSCTSISDVLPSGFSSSDFTHLRRADTIRKRPADGESSATRSKGANASSGGCYAVSMHTGPGSSSSSMDQAMHQPVSRRTRNRPNIRDGPVSVRTRRASSGESQIRLSVQANDNILPLDEPIMIPQYQFITQRASAGESQRRLSVQGDDSTLPLDEPIMIPQYQWARFSLPQAPPEISSRSSHAFHNSYGQPGSSSQASQSRLASRLDHNNTQMYYGSLGDDYRFNMEGHAEVLLGLEQIEQDEALTYEQLLVLETRLLFRGLSLHDQHRNLRMDIDNMTYEELLALEEKMGTVSTALSEEQLSKCLKRSLYAPTYQPTGTTVCGDDDMKCSICQEEYVGEDEVGKLPCEHLYHVTCIKQWLRQKNWCPICKSSAVPS